jgi:hypothetical protein
MRAITVSLLILSGLGSAVTSAVGQEAPTLNAPIGPVETADRPKINTGNKGGPPYLTAAPAAPAASPPYLSHGSTNGLATGTSSGAANVDATMTNDTTGTYSTGTTGSEMADSSSSLPATASSLPLLAMIGLFAFLASLSVRLLRSSRTPRR